MKNECYLLKLFQTVKACSLLMLLILSSITSWAQTSQSGVIKEYNEKAEKTPLPGVEVSVRSANNTTSDLKGEFLLRFLTLHPGEKVNVRHIEKLGYELFNKEALEQWNINPSQPFVIVMCRSDKFKSIRDNYQRLASANYDKQFKKEQANLTKLKNEGKLKETEYQERLQELAENYDRQLDNLENYVDKFARIDLSELSAAEQGIIELVQQGKFEEAIQKYEDQHYLEKYKKEINDIKEISSAINQMNDIKQSKEQTSEALLASIDRQMSTLKLAGGYDNLLKVYSILEELANADCTNIENALNFARFALDFKYEFELAKTKVNNILAQLKADSNTISKDGVRAFNLLGSILLRQGKFNQAIEMYAQAGDIAEEIYDENSLELSDSYNNLGIAYSEIADYQKALEYYKKALNIVISLCGENHEETAKCYHNLASLNKDLGDYQVALEFYELTLKIKNAVFGENHLEVGETLNNIAVIYDILDEHSMSIEYFARAKAIFADNYGETHPYVANVDDNIGTLFSNMGKYDESLKYHKKALETRLKVYGRLHPLTATSYMNSASVYALMHQYDTAKDYALEALSIDSEIYSVDHPNVAVSYNTLGYISYALKDYENAKNYFEKVYNIRRATQGEDHIDMASTYDNLGNTYYELGDIDSAIEYHLMSLNLKSRILGENHSSVGISYSNIGNIYMDLKEYDKAIDYFEKSIAIKEHVLGNDNIKLTISLSNMGTLYYKLKDYDKAVAYFQKSLDILKVNENADPNDIVKLYDMFCTIYTRTNDQEALLSNALCGLKYREQIYGSQHPELSTSHSLIASAYYGLRELEKALLHIKQAVNIDESFYAINDVHLTRNYTFMAQILDELSTDNPKYSQEYSIFMSDKIWVGTVVDNSPAALMGLSEKYYILEFGDWNYKNNNTIMNASKNLTGKPKDVLFLKDDNMSYHHFDDKLGVMFSLEKVTADKQSQIDTAYDNWKLYCN